MQQKWTEAIDFDQCQAGAYARKPTRLAAIHLPELRREIRRLPNAGWCTHGKNFHEAQLGHTEQDTWRTAPLKEYPSRLCEAMGRAFAGRVF